mmetsp:Transcript_168144/g.540101  ORF Transcript_168144/g.540101 Transcript_168144/m.540101 type:complete len:271 (+) Transcript_168144:767-1579(+)
MAAAMCAGMSPKIGMEGSAVDELDGVAAAAAAGSPSTKAVGGRPPRRARKDIVLRDGLTPQNASYSANVRTVPKPYFSAASPQPSEADAPPAASAPATASVASAAAEDAEGDEGDATAEGAAMAASTTSTPNIRRTFSCDLASRCFCSEQACSRKTGRCLRVQRWKPTTHVGAKKSQPEVQSREAIEGSSPKKRSSKPGSYGTSRRTAEEEKARPAAQNRALAGTPPKLSTLTTLPPILRKPSAAPNSCAQTAIGCLPLCSWARSGPPGS